MRENEIASGVVGESITGVTAVRNWNAAAASSTGELLFVIADDLHPPDRWDEAVDRVFGRFDPTRTPFVVKVRDSSDASSMLIRHPLISRRYYEMYGLWNPLFQGHFVDNDFTYSAYGRNLVIDGRAIEFRHRHHSVGAERSESHLRMMTSHDVGRQLIEARWPLWKRRSVRIPLRPGRRTTVRMPERVARAGVARIGHLTCLITAKRPKSTVVG